ncbi:hypothetical protein [uncultured Ornithinimicrobium sp.]|uniref:hypothetical protein n=1 Tax=uncultured Ornithinimicrobium sp. TaxID=259307 RepID=UPI0025941975|nr:hypothetical protein [uncultured Ornithinimicrobium sp.]
MSEQVQGQGSGGPATPAPDRLAPGEPEQLVYVLETRFAASRDAASAAVRDAERELAEATQRRERAEREAAEEEYTSDPLVFMRQSVAEEVDALRRKTTGKKVRVSYRFLLDRSVELAAAEVDRFHSDRDAALREAQEGLDALREAEQRAAAAVEAAHLAQERVRAAEQAARDGLGTLLDKLGGTGA